ncbi:ribosome hibernation-promoting factor, HPF/YfiA family [Sulfurospirillum arcachonense]|uniref:ribosome hibernation-promoting factor, HPF/YfiA family n=1 Tax=Sulfurospirillum arcachonense TaxID=57666 RepID=UPI00046A6696|nr:ribosome-associated translation inhibitor RaiA [Sulfurospirillum arcachonense]
MNLSIVGKQLELTDAIKSHVESGKDSLTKYNLDIISTRCVLSADEKNGKKGFSAEFAINLAHKNTIVIKQKDKDLYAAIDLAIERAKKVLRRHHDKITNHKIKEDIVEEVAIEDVDEVIPTRLDSYKPIEIEEALNALKESAMQFFVFTDMDDKMRVIYKRADDKYGLY